MDDKSSIIYFLELLSLLGAVHGDPRVYTCSGQFPLGTICRPLGISQP